MDCSAHSVPKLRPNLKSWVSGWSCPLEKSCSTSARNPRKGEACTPYPSCSGDWQQKRNNMTKHGQVSLRHGAGGEGGESTQPGKSVVKPRADSWASFLGFSLRFSQPEEVWGVFSWTASHPVPPPPLPPQWFSSSRPKECQCSEIK